MKSTMKNSAFFHTLVVVGGSIVGCGGQAHDAGEESGDGDGARSGGRAGIGSGDGDGDVASGSGGTIIGSGGSNGVGGGIILATGGATGAGGEYMGGAHGLGCPPEQWECGDVYYDCSWEDDEILGNCACDETKPTRAGDCPDGTSFTCRAGMEYDAESNGTEQAFDCTCLPTKATCDEQCQPLVSPPFHCGGPIVDAEGFVGFLCGCELPVLR
jgi:hypothetical protein